MFDPIDDIILAIHDGEMVVMADDENRENEGDIICAADKITPEIINFMTKHARGLICVPLDSIYTKRLKLGRMNKNDGGDLYGTAFMDSVDAATDDVTTGISAYDRFRTVQVLVDDHSNTSDLRRPGHMFPLEAVEGGVLRRPGHTEAAVDLARLAGLNPAGVICEIMQEDGEMARLPQLIEFAREHGLKIGSVEELIYHRRRTEMLVKKVRKVQMPTEFGDFDLHLYYSYLDDCHHLALVMGEPEKDEKGALVRIHSECLTGDVFGSRRCDCGTQLHRAMQAVADEGCGVVLYMRQEGRGIGLEHKIAAYELQEQGLDTVEANIHLGFDADLRDYGSGAQILEDLGLHKIRLMTNNPGKIEGLEHFGLEIVERVSIIVQCSEHNERYLSTKKEKMGHLL
ncbi:MAG: bifunctional 3,4-dihydroxy-2-butanone-4-phosphate synthase/GTP cyclohydrolase II [Spartobacteria bacterium]|nr:bifunctional 3,4-dihydroxy-2-butanone-4-phosphate synthase/GTP cyclohydrolase II [Spartobacteria bacterium]